MMTCRWWGQALVAVATVLLAGCAHGGSAGRPSPFPNAPSLPPIIENPRHPTVAAEVVERALTLRGSPYRVGGDRPTTGFDCSGLVRYLFAEVQVDLPRTVAEQFKVGRAIAVTDVQPGDLVFFTTSMPGPSHVGLVLDQTTFVHAPGSGSVVRVERFDTPYWSTRLNGVRRVAEDP